MILGVETCGELYGAASLRPFKGAAPELVLRDEGSDGSVAVALRPFHGRMCRVTAHDGFLRLFEQEACVYVQGRSVALAHGGHVELLTRLVYDFLGSDDLTLEWSLLDDGGVTMVGDILGGGLYGYGRSLLAALGEAGMLGRPAHLYLGTYGDEDGVTFATQIEERDGTTVVRRLDGDLFPLSELLRHEGRAWDLDPRAGHLVAVPRSEYALTDLDAVAQAARGRVTRTWP